MKKNKKNKVDTGDDFEFDDAYTESELEPFYLDANSSRRVQALRAIEEAKEEMALRKSLEDFPDYI
ncbi:MAG: hypothetical protein OEU86_05325 [Gammaproteobacteria bacterium]|nr:hypothetical protein [Gammaproteobacteria bacterium]